MTTGKTVLRSEFTEAHFCTGIDCGVCIEGERKAASERLDTLPTKARKFAARKRSASVTTEAKRINRVLDGAQGGVQYTSGVRDRANERVRNYSDEIDGTPDEINATITRLNGVDTMTRNAEPLQTSLREPETGEPFVAEPGRIKESAKALKFMLAGNATFTLRSVKTGVRYTYKVTAVPAQTPEDVRKWGKKYFVALLTGPDNQGDFTYLGMLQGQRFRLTAKSKMRQDSAPVKAFDWTLRQLLFEGTQRPNPGYGLPPQLEFWHEGRCGVCNRPLTVPESIESGIGPVCAEKGGY